MRAANKKTPQGLLLPAGSQVPADVRRPVKLSIGTPPAVRCTVSNSMILGCCQEYVTGRFSSSRNQAAVMQTLTGLSCPKCGNTSPEKVSERRANQSGFFAPPSNAPNETIYVFHCRCGATFTHSVKDGERQKKAAG